MTVAAYRDRTSGRYPITLDEVRSLSPVLFGEAPPQEALDEVNVDPVTATSPPSYDATKQMALEGAPEKVSGTWRQTWTLSDLPVTPIITWKSDIWRRCSEIEAAILDNALNEAPVKDRRAWDDSMQIESTAPEFADFRSQMVAAFGESRTAEILAPSEN